MVSERNRATERAPARLQVNYAYEGCYLISFSGNLSPDGIYLCCERPAPVGTHLTLVFPFPNHQELSAEARVVWSSSNGHRGQSGMGLQFLAVAPMLRATFLDIVNRIAILGPDLGVDVHPCGTA